MNPVAGVRKFLQSPENQHQGLQMASAVVLAYLVSWLAGLPEHFWAAMSALIVIRPNMASTLGAAFDRVRSTLLGAVCGLLGVGLARFGVAALASTLGIVAVLAYVSAAAPGLRSAPIAALIILSSTDIAGHSALQVAFLRVVQIAIGVGVALAISKVSSRYRAADRLNAGCASLLRGAAARMAQMDAPARPAEAQAERAGEDVRKAFGRLSGLAASADKVPRIFRKMAPTSDARHHRRIAGLTRRVFQDVAMFNRITLAHAGAKNEGAWHEAAAVASAALAGTAHAIEGMGEVDLSRLGQLAGDVTRGAQDEPAPAGPAALLAAPLHLLFEDLQGLCRCIHNSAA
ncbi:MAG: FUSC family protein [Rhodoferax sp.]